MLAAARFAQALGGCAGMVVSRAVVRDCFDVRTSARVYSSLLRPLFVTARGMPAADAARLVESMHGGHRIPTLIARVDHLARGRA